MPRPQNKEELINAMCEEFGKLCKILDETPREILQQDFSSPSKNNARDKNARDVVSHICAWQAMLRDFITNNTQLQNGIRQPTNSVTPFLPPPYNWATYPKLNIVLWQKSQNISLEEAICSLKQGFKEVLQLVLQFSNEQLFTKRHFAFTNSTSLASYAISSTSSHYAWAIKQLKSGLKESLSQPNLKIRN